VIRLFLVGCSRSGTSIVQRELYRNLGLYSLPETGYFDVASSRSNYWMRLYALKLLLIAGGLMENPTEPRLIKYAKVFRITAKLLGLRRAVAIFSGRLPPRDAFLWIMDTLTQQAECRGWVEKTPKHFRHVDALLDAAPNARVLFVVRNGLDVVASIRDRFEKHPDGKFAGQQDPQYAIDLWNESLAAAQQAINHPRVGLIDYEEFCQNPEQQISQLAEFVGAARETTPAERVEFDIRTSQETWKEGLAQGIAVSPSKAPLYFSPDEMARIQGELNYQSYEQLRQSAVGYDANN